MPPTVPKASPLELSASLWPPLDALLQLNSFFNSVVPKTTHRIEGETLAEQSGTIPSFDRLFPEADAPFPPAVVLGRVLRAPAPLAGAAQPRHGGTGGAARPQDGAVAGGTSRG